MGPSTVILVMMRMTVSKEWLVALVALVAVLWTGGSVVAQAEPAAPAESAGSATVVVYGPLMEPVPNARVVVKTDFDEVVREGKTDANGVFAVEKLPAGSLYVHASAPDMTTSAAALVPSVDPSYPSHVDIRLYPGAVVRGRVVDAAGDGIGGAEVIAGADYLAYQISRRRPPTVVADKDGYFELTGVPLGEVVVRASAAGYSFGESALYVREDAEATVMLRAGPGRKVVVEVKGVPAERLAQLHCTWTVRGEGYQGLLVPERLRGGSFDKDGRCVIEGLPPAAKLSMIQVPARGITFEPGYHEVPAGVAGTVAFEVKSIAAPPQDGGAAADAPAPDAPPAPVGKTTLRGTVVDPDGRPAPGVRIRIHCFRTGAHECITRADGTFSTTAAFKTDDYISFSVSGGAWVLDHNERYDGSTSDSVSLDYVEGKEYRFSLQRTARVAGRVEASKGTDVGGLKVTLSRADGYGTVGSAFTDKDGAFVIVGFRPTRDALRVSVSDLRGTATIERLKTKGKLEVDGVRLRLQEPFEVRGTIRDRRKKPVVGARVELFEWDDTVKEKEPDGTFTITDKEGRFVYRGVEPGEYALRARVEGLEYVVVSKPFEVGKRRVVEQKLRIRAGRKR